MSIPHYKTKLSELTPAEYRAVADANSRQLDYVVGVSVAIRVRSGVWVNYGDVMPAILNAVQDSNIDLSRCQTAAEISAHILAALVTGQRALGVEHGCQPGVQTGVKSE